MWESTVNDGMPRNSEEIPDSHILCSYICRNICAEISLDFVTYQASPNDWIKSKTTERFSNRFPKGKRNISMIWKKYTVGKKMNTLTNHLVEERKVERMHNCHQIFSFIFISIHMEILLLSFIIYGFSHSAKLCKGHFFNLYSQAYTWILKTP